MARFCDKCGHELANEKGKFCDRCGAELKYESDSSAGSSMNIPIYTEEKSMAVAMLLSFIFAGTGIAYAGNLEKGIGIFVVSIIVNFITISTGGIFFIFTLAVWIAGMVLTYKEVENVNNQRRMMLNQQYQN
ncbi:zinc ribbon domain-containing protein [uncultured Methanobrevibacter sp.]|uniref:zinc ribbon domain-containing protein n=1 Tax=uncultured Methanobrevibacter sp. TaxID=253161 RepID=UPI0025F71326|nr:zinc ribbon domain-containing protein [uncultured Methanobrevibacter sp.]